MLFRSYLKFELPEFNIIDFTIRGKEVNSIVSTIKKDTWLHAGGIIGLHKENERELLHRIHTMNIISLIHENEFSSGLPRVLKIVKNNSHILFHRDLQRKLLAQVTGRSEEHTSELQSH